MDKPPRPFQLATRRQLGIKDNILMIEIKINTDTLQNSLNAIAQRTSNTQPLMTQLARIMRNAVLDNFEAGGRPRGLRASIRPREKDRGCCRPVGVCAIRLRRTVRPRKPWLVPMLNMRPFITSADKLHRIRYCRKTAKP